MEEMEMTVIETARLIDWLVQNGHTYQEAAQCIEYIAYAQKNNGQEKELPDR